MQDKRMFPVDAKLGRVLGVLRILSNNKGKITVKRLTELSKGNVAILLPQVNAAKMLGLVFIEKHTLILEDLGEKLRKDDEDSIGEIKDRLRWIEPFRSCCELSLRKKSFTTEDVLKELYKKRLLLHSSKRESLNILSTLLIQWAIFFNLLDYDGLNGKWRRQA